MQFIKSVLLSTAVVASLASAAPVAQDKRMAIGHENKINSSGGDLMADFKKLYPNSKLFSRDVSQVPEKRLSWGKAAAGAAAAVVGWFTTKEGQEFLASDEGKAFVSKMAANDDSLSKREPLNAAAMIGLTGGSILKGIFGSKEAADEFLSTDEGKDFMSKLAASDETLSKREPLNAAAMIGLTGGSILKGIFGSKEPADEFLATDAGKEFVSKLSVDNESLSGRDFSEVVEKRLSWGKAAAGAAAAVVGWFTTKEGQEFLATDEGKAFVSKMAANDESLSKREPLNPAVMIGLTGGSALSSIFGSKEAADEFLATEEGKKFAASLESRDIEKREPLNAAGIGAAIFAGTAIYNGLKDNFGSKEAADEFLATDEGKEFISKLAVNDESLSRREPLNAAAMIGLTGGSILKGIFGSKEAADEFLATDEEKEFVSSLGRRDDAAEKRLAGAPVWAKIGATLVGMGGAATGGWFATKEGQDALTDALNSADLQARGKADYGSLAAAIINGFNAIRSRDVDSLSSDDMEKRLTPAVKFAAAAIAASFAGGSIAKNIATRDADFDLLG